jgi:hypothetical protein
MPKAIRRRRIKATLRRGAVQPTEPTRMPKAIRRRRIKATLRR